MQHMQHTYCKGKIKIELTKFVSNHGHETVKCLSFRPTPHCIRISIYIWIRGHTQLVIVRCYTFVDF